MYGYKLMNYRKVKLLMGGVDRKLMLRLFHEARLTPGSHKAWKYISAMESRLDQVLTKMGAAEDILDAGHVLKRDLVYLNGSLPTRRNDYFVQPGDVLSPNAADPQELKNHVARAMRPLLERVYNSF